MCEAEYPARLLLNNFLWRTAKDDRLTDTSDRTLARCGVIRHANLEETDGASSLLRWSIGRSFLQIGGLGMGGLSLPTLLKAEAVVPQASRTAHKSVIMVYLSGGLAHQDTFDLKPDAPEGIRGELKPIPTCLPGVQISELLPKIAGVLDKVALIRSIVNLRDEHSSFQNLTGFPMAQSQREGRPSFGSVIARVKGPVDTVVPPFIDLFPVMQHRPYNSPGPGFLGHPYRPARMDGDDLTLLKVPATFPFNDLKGVAHFSTSLTSFGAMITERRP